MDAIPLLLLGPPTLHTARGGEPFPAERRFQLLGYLACRNTWVARDQLAALFWPEHENAAARSNLRYLLLKLRRDGLVALEARGDLLRWAIDADLHRFERAIAAADWTGALALYRGPLLSGLERDAPPAFADWLRLERQRVAAARRRAVAARLDELADDPASAAALAQEALREDPFDEAALLAWLRAAAALKRPDEALRAYAAYARRLAGELGVEPSAALREAVAHRASAPAPRPVTPKVAGFVGRRAEFAQLGQLLASADCRVLTVLGTGGVGKSTLARAAAAALAPQFDAVLWIELDELASVDQVAPRLAHQLGIDERGADAPLDRVIRHLRARRVLLVFDGAEHLPGIHKILADLVRRCTDVKLLVTSRERLATADEWLLPLEGLPVPDAEETDAEVLRAFDAVRLFETRATSAAPGFDLRAHAADVAALTRIVEGLPLALELAAARVRLLPVAGILREIAGSLDAIEPAAAHGRERSLRASFAHSWQLLAPAERDALAALAVFPGGFSHEAAGAVAEAPLPLLAALVDKSLVRSDGRGRFSLHALVRQCALEKLGPAAERAGRRRHAAYFVHWLGRYGDFDHIDQKQALAEIEREMSNCLAAWQHLARDADPGRWHRLAEMADPFKRFFEFTGRVRAGIELLSHVAGTDGDAPPQARGRILHALAFLQFRIGVAQEAESHARQALRCLRAARDLAAAPGALNTLGLALWQRGRLDEARRCFAQALRHARQLQLDTVVERATSNLAIIERVRGNYERAAALYRQVLDAASARHDGMAIARTWNNIGDVHRACGDWAAAQHCFEQALQAVRAHGLAGLLAPVLVNLALAQLEAGACEPSAGTAREALTLARATGETYSEASALAILARVAIATGDHRSGDEHLRNALLLARGGHADLEQALIDVRAEALAARGEPVAATAHWLMLAQLPGLNAEQQRRIDTAVAHLRLPERDLACARELAAELDLTRAGDALLAPAPAP